jgi:hypothetical protein
MLTTKDLSDEDMLKIMADENMTEYNANPQVIRETVRAVVLAFAEGKIDLQKPKALLETAGRKANGQGIQIAPSFRQTDISVTDLKTDPNLKAYNAESITTFLEWGKGDQVHPVFRDALAVLESMEEELLAEEDFKDMTINQAGEVARQAKTLAHAYEVSARNKPKEYAEEVRAKGK